MFHYLDRYQSLNIYIFIYIYIYIYISTIKTSDVMLQHANILSNELSRYHQIFSISNYCGTLIEESFCHVNVPRGRRSNQPWSMVELPCPRTKRCWRTGCQDGSQSFLSHSTNFQGFQCFLCSICLQTSQESKMHSIIHPGYEEYPASVKVLQFLLLAEWCCWWWLPAGLEAIRIHFQLLFEVVTEFDLAEAQLQFSEPRNGKRRNEDKRSPVALLVVQKSQTTTWDGNKTQ